MGRVKGKCEILKCTKCGSLFRGKRVRKYSHLCTACSWHCGTTNILSGRNKT